MTTVDSTVLVPTYNEGDNVEELVRQIEVWLPRPDVEILFVDDSTDDTPHVIDRVAGHRSRTLPVRLLHRAGEQRVGGLSGAVVAGIQHARGNYVIVMDGDLQHPPSLLPLLRQHLDHADLVVASRYCGPEGDASGLSGRYRRWVSSGSTMLAQACFPRRVGRVCTDPMTGFFGFRRDAVDLSQLQPRGFKILFEILARHDLRVTEVPFSFGERFAGESKASWRNGLQFLRQMLSLRMGAMSRFAAVGALGTLVNLAVLWLLVHLTSVHYLPAAVIAAEISIAHNFLMQERFVFRYLRQGTWLRRAAHFFAFNNVETLLRLPLLILLVERLGLRPTPSQALLLGLAFIGRFLFTSRIVYRQPAVEPGTFAHIPRQLPRRAKLDAA